MVCSVFYKAPVNWNYINKMTFYLRIAILDTFQWEVVSVITLLSHSSSSVDLHQRKNKTGRMRIVCETPVNTAVLSPHYWLSVAVQRIHTDICSSCWEGANMQWCLTQWVSKCVTLGWSRCLVWRDNNLCRPSSSIVSVPAGWLETGVRSHQTLISSHHFNIKFPAGRPSVYHLHLFPHLTLLCSGLVVSTGQVYNSIHPVAKINLL